MTCLQTIFIWIWIVVLWLLSLLTDPIVIIKEYAL